MESNVIAFGGWKGQQVTVTMATGHEAMILRESLLTYLRLYPLASDESVAVCEEAVASITDQLRNQEPPTPPAPSLNPSSAQVPAAGGPFNFGVVSDGDPAQWTAAANDSFLTVISPSGPWSGDRAVGYTIEQNTADTPRTGTITIGGFNLTFTVNQDAASTGETVEQQSTQEPAEHHHNKPRHNRKP